MAFSKIIAGTMTWGQWGKKCNSVEMIELMEACLNEGINTFDHADIYGDYSTEADFGKAFAESKINREEIKLISKCGIQLVSESRGSALGHYDYSKNYIISQA